MFEQLSTIVTVYNERKWMDWFLHSTFLLQHSVLQSILRQFPIRVLVDPCLASDTRS